MSTERSAASKGVFAMVPSPGSRVCSSLEEFRSVPLLLLLLPRVLVFEEGDARFLRFGR